MTLSVQKLSASLQSVCFCWTNRMCVASFGFVNGRNTCRLQRKADIFSPPSMPLLDSHLTASLKSNFAPFFSLLFFSFSYTFFFSPLRQAQKFGINTGFLYKWPELCYLCFWCWGEHWCVWHSNLPTFSYPVKKQTTFFIFLILHNKWHKGAFQQLPHLCRWYGYSPIRFTLNLSTFHGGGQKKMNCLSFKNTFKQYQQWK